jgi:hypothetical protein
VRDVLHQILVTIVRLELSFTCRYFLIALIVINLLLGPQGLRKVVNVERQRDQVLLHPVEHVPVCLLVHSLEVVVLRDVFELGLCLLFLLLATAKILADGALFTFSSLHIFLWQGKKSVTCLVLYLPRAFASRLLCR